MKMTIRTPNIQTLCAASFVIACGLMAGCNKTPTVTPATSSGTSGGTSSGTSGTSATSGATPNTTSSGNVSGATSPSSGASGNAGTATSSDGYSSPTASEYGREHESSGSSSGSSSSSSGSGNVLADTAVTAKVKAALIADSDLKSMGITVDTTNGVVTLSGSLQNQAQIDRATQLASNINGVKNVTNSLAIKR